MSEKLSVKNVNGGWIRKESKSRPNHFYYFNTKTGESRWDESASATTKKSPEKNNTKLDGVKSVKMTSPTLTRNVSKEKEKKISSKSREGECFRFTVTPTDYLLYCNER